jgi:hypothetical protein
VLNLTTLPGEPVGSRYESCADGAVHHEQQRVHADGLAQLCMAGFYLPLQSILTKLTYFS